MILFLVPSLLLFVAQGLGTIRQLTAETPAFAALLIGLLLLDPVLTAAKHLVKPARVEEVRSAIDYIEGHRAAGDILYCYYAAALPLQYYRERGRIGAIEQITGVASREDRERYTDDLDRLRWVESLHRMGPVAAPNDGDAGNRDRNDRSSDQSLFSRREVSRRSISHLRNLLYAGFLRHQHARRQGQMAIAESDQPDS